ncbi:MAG: SPOR domain-containing protein [Bacteroidaceae bacterium]|nr:SPOR domain-containing protein [Bacteroidaceae bacterium]MBR1942010.1 SPOR domain-containing protein [Bacteroidaceae bacterium]MBR3626267.1 SPOR domain-containing protein [Bacteroidaceae bacterium]
MKKFAFLGLGLCMALAFTSCKSSESAYKKAYEKAKQQELAQGTAVQQQTAPATVSASAETATPAPSADVRQEKVTIVAGNGALQDYSVVCGSFGVKTNAENLKNFLDNEGYNAIIVYNADRNMYRVVSETFSNRDAAARARDAFKAKYPNRQDFQGSWLLYRMN